MNTAKNNLRVVLIEDSPLLQEMVAEELGNIETVKLAGIADGQAEALDLIENQQPDLVIIDLELAEGTGIGVLESLSNETGRYGSPQKVIFTNHTSSRLKSLCVQFGLDGYFDKSYQFEELTDYIHKLARAG